MKKNTERKLSLGKMKVASLSKPDQEMVKGGKVAVKVLIIRCSVSACAQQCC